MLYLSLLLELEFNVIFVPMKVTVASNQCSSTSLHLWVCTIFLVLIRSLPYPRLLSRRRLFPVPNVGEPIRVVVLVVARRRWSSCHIASTHHASLDPFRPPPTLCRWAAAQTRTQGFIPVDSQVASRKTMHALLDWIQLLHVVFHLVLHADEAGPSYTFSNRPFARGRGKSRSDRVESGFRPDFLPFHFLKIAI
jgi:hypothetical protein